MRARIAALMAVGTFGLHQLRFTLAGEDASHVHGHGYLTVAGPLLAGLLLLALTLALARFARGRTHRAPSMLRVWLGASTALVAVYCAQESLEGQHALFAHGGWLAIPLAVAIGFAIALLARTSPPVPAAWRTTAPATALFVLLRPWRSRPHFVAFLAVPGRGPPPASV
jgi:uncharacterized membrane protein YidH (DUF202 family)